MSSQTFHRRLDPPLIEALNKLAADSDSWWHALISDKATFIAIRDRYLNVYLAGGSIARIGWSKNRVTVKVHHEYLTLPVPGDPYIDLNAAVPRDTLRPVISSLIDYTADLGRIKRRVDLFIGGERRGENQLARRIPNVIDMEIAFNFDEQNDDNPELTHPKSGRIDLAYVQKSGDLTFVEIKLYENQELHANGRPRVCQQLTAYAGWIEQHGDDLLKAYEEVRAAYSKLQGPFFEQRRAAFDKQLELDIVPRLLIYSYDQWQEKEAKSLGRRVAKWMREKCGLPGFSDEHVLAKGNITSFDETDFT